MPLTMRTNARPFPFAILGPTLENTDVKLKWSDERIAILSLDPNAIVVTDPFDPAQGQRSLVSGMVRPAGQPGTTDVTANLVDWTTDPDTTLATVTDTLTVVEPGEGVPEWAGTFFGGTLALTVTAAEESAPAKSSHHRRK
jgi:hypothetical protein